MNWKQFGNTSRTQVAGFNIFCAQVRHIVVDNIERSDCVFVDEVAGEIDAAAMTERVKEMLPSNVDYNGYMETCFRHAIEDGIQDAGCAYIWPKAPKVPQNTGTQVAQRPGS